MPLPTQPVIFVLYFSSIQRVEDTDPIVGLKWNFPPSVHLCFPIKYGSTTAKDNNYLCAEVGLDITQRCSKKAEGSVVYNRIGMKFGRIVLRIKYRPKHRLMDCDFWFDVIISRLHHDIISRRKVLPPGECTHLPASMQQRPPVPGGHSYLLYVNDSESWNQWITSCMKSWNCEILLCYFKTGLSIESFLFSAYKNVISGWAIARTYP